MSVADPADMLRRLARLVPNGWFADTAALRDVVLGGCADALAWVAAQSAIVRAGTRRAGAIGWLLDLDAFGFLGVGFLRRVGESDTSWRVRWSDEIFRPRVTRAALDKTLEDLTGTPPRIVELWNANDCGAYDCAGLAYAGETYAPASAAGYDQNAAYDTGGTSYDPQSGPTGTASPGMGMWGSVELPFQFFITAYRPSGGGVVNADGLDVAGGYDLGVGLRYVSDDEEATAVISDDEILATVARTQAAGVIAWTAIENAPAA